LKRESKVLEIVRREAIGTGGSHNTLCVAVRWLTTPLTLVRVGLGLLWVSRGVASHQGALVLYCVLSPGGPFTQSTSSMASQHQFPRAVTDGRQGVVRVRQRLRCFVRATTKGPVGQPHGCVLLKRPDVIICHRRD
jgi:hypothetical protein